MARPPTAEPSAAPSRHAEALAREDRPRALGKAPVYIVLVAHRRALARARRSGSSSPRSLARRHRVGGLVEGLLQAEPRDARELPRALRERGDHVARSGRRSGSRSARRPADRRRRARRLRVRLARVPGPRLALHRRRRALVVPIQMALIPIFSLYNDARPVRHDPRPRPVPHRVRAAVRDLPAAELLRRDPARPARGGADRRRLGVPDLLPGDPAARPAGDRVARDLPVPLGVERPARRADLRPRHAADHRRDLRAAAAVRRQHRAHRAGRVHLAGRSRSSSSSPSSATSCRGCSPAP